MSEYKLKITGNWLTGKIFIDDIDISQYVTGFHLDAKKDKIKANFEMLFDEIDIETNPNEVEFKDLLKEIKRKETSG